MSRDDVQVVKLGGSLLDLPDLSSRLDHCRHTYMTPQAVLLVGGGSAADTVRQFDQHHSLGPEYGHWLAIRAMQFNTHLVASMLTRCRIVANAEACISAWNNGDLPIADPLEWLENEHRNGVTIPHRWSFTSDSIAAHLAVRLGAQRLTLLKSTLPADVLDIPTAASRGMVDSDFQSAAQTIPYIDCVNARTQPMTNRVLRQP